MNNFRLSIYSVIEQSKDRSTVPGIIYNYVMFAAVIMGIVPLMFMKMTPLLIVIDLISCIIFIIDYMLRWMTADYKLGDKYGKWCFVFYPFTFMAIIDMLSILPTLCSLHNVFKVLRVSRLLKVTRIFKLLVFYEPMQMIIRILKREGKVLMSVLLFAVFYILLIALIMFNVEDLQADGSHRLFNNFFEAVYWATCTLTTVGYGDFCPVTTLGRAICVVSSLVGIAIIALPSGIIASAYIEEIRKRKNNLPGND